MKLIKYILVFSCCFSAAVFSLENSDVCSSSFSNYAEFMREFFSHPQNIAQYKGQKGYMQFVEEHLDFLQMDTVFKYVSIVLSKRDMKRLNWQRYQGTVKEFKKERARILDEKGEVKKEHQDQGGYARYAEEFYGEEGKGDMFKAYTNVSAALSAEEMRDLGWKVFVGDTGQLRALFEFFEARGFRDYKGAEGQKKIARLIFNNNLKNTYTNVSALRDSLFKNEGESQNIDNAKDSDDDKNNFKALRGSGWSIDLSW